MTDYSADYDLILMDIEMAFLNGMKSAEKIRELDKDVIIIFITNMPQ
ncbi:response regulator, partial [Blautia schinkii]